MAFHVVVRLPDSSNIKCALLFGDTRLVLIKELAIRKTGIDFADYEFYFQHFQLDNEVALQMIGIEDGNVILGIPRTLLGPSFPVQIVLTTRAIEYKIPANHIIPVFLKIDWQPSKTVLLVETEAQQSIVDIRRKVGRILGDFKTIVDAFVGDTQRNEEQTVKELELTSGGAIVFRPRSG
jgi:hypothetical protein